MSARRSPAAAVGLRRTARHRALALVIASATMVACSPASSADSGMTVDSMNPSALAGAPPADTAGARAPMATAAAMQAVATRRIYFAHQSVGGNILAGIERLRAAQPASALRIVESRDPSTVQGPAFVHFLAGRNTDPASKNADFLAMLDARPARDGGIALLKYCYLDMRSDSDPAAVFAGYTATVAAARAKHPDLTIVHLTMPLTTVESGPKALVKRVLGKTTTRDIARKRQQYNAMLLREYAGREPVFDIAALESTRPGGARAAFRQGGETIFTLAPEYTDDGGHLNAAGQQLAAERLLAFLATLPTSHP